MHTTLVDAAMLQALLADDEVLIFDCSFELAHPAAGQARYDGGHIPAARYLHLDDQLSGKPDGTNGRHPLPDPALLAEALRAAGLSEGRQVIAYDDGDGAFAARLWWLLRWLGHEAVAVLDGGKAAWQAAGYPLTTATPEPSSGTFAPRTPSLSPVVTVSQIREAGLCGERRIIDARSPERFRGDPNPLDPVAGHIPGAGNRFFKNNLLADGRFKPACALAAEFAAVCKDAPPSAVILYCGSGVTACHNALAMEHAGMGGAALYPGSWSEWISDGARPVERLTA